MSQEQIEKLEQNLVRLDNGQVLTSSLMVAEKFGKRHERVLDAIRRIVDEIEPVFREHNFVPTLVDVPGPNGAVRKSPAYSLTRDAFSLVVMGFTGKRALAWKVRYIEAFNAMEQALLQHVVPESNNAPLEKRRRGPQFTPATPAQIKGLRGLIEFWSSFEEVSASELEDRVLQAHGLPSIDYVQNWDLTELEWYLLKSLYRASGQVTTEETSENDLRVLNGLLDFASGLREIKRSDLEGIVCEMCSVRDLNHLTPLGVKKAELLLWTFMNRFPTRRDCLSEAKFIFNEVDS